MFGDNYLNLIVDSLERISFSERRGIDMGRYRVDTSVMIFTTLQLQLQLHDDMMKRYS